MLNRHGKPVKCLGLLGNPSIYARKLMEDATNEVRERNREEKKRAVIRANRR